MNHCVPDRNYVDDIGQFTDLCPVSNQKKSMGSDHELVELLWRNGQVVLNSQTHRKTTPGLNESKYVHKPEEPLNGSGSFGNSSNLIQDDDTALWLHCPIDDSIEKEFCSEFFYEFPTIADLTETDRPSKEIIRAERHAMFSPPKETNTNLQAKHSGASKIVNFSHFSRLNKASLGSPNDPLGNDRSGKMIEGEVCGSSMMSNCGSNQVQNEANLNQVSRNIAGGGEEDVRKTVFPNERQKMYPLGPTFASSSGGSQGSLGRMTKETASNQSLKRKSRDGDESECQSEEAEFESVEASKPAKQSASARRSRAAEVHNLSERRRRDRINEKMKALQELIPNSNKTDKASMLDEAIEYLKSLQLQVQIMWIATGMAPMMFPGIQQYTSPVGMGVGQAAMNGPVQFARVPFMDQSLTPALTPNHAQFCPSPLLNPVNFQNQVQNTNMPESYAQYLGFHPLQMVPQTMHHDQRMTPNGNSNGPSNGVPSDNIQTGNVG